MAGKDSFFLSVHLERALQNGGYQTDGRCDRSPHSLLSQFPSALPPNRLLVSRPEVLHGDAPAVAHRRGANRTTHYVGEAVLDWALICFSAYLFLARFTMHYAIFYGVSRLVGDLEIFLLSPAFSPRSDEIVGGDEKLKLAWRKAGCLEKWWKAEVATDCLMPSGPGCTVVSFTSSEVWRYALNCTLD